MSFFNRFKDISVIMHMDDERFNDYCNEDGEVIDDNVCVCLSRLTDDSSFSSFLDLEEFCDKVFDRSIDEVYAIFPNGFK
jgi:hypothetical protein